ncbi:MAG: farnesyl-diphosphate farnesyltransferase [Phycisphaerae bacterium]|nr:MAG: farnesyl-diphosphate farnesyltransferase [Phycisphaerae bacterium]
MSSSISQTDHEFQARMLMRISRTFALTIPQLPEPLATIVGNAYLWCRIADTIEDCPEISLEEKPDHIAALIAVIRGDCAPNDFAEDLLPRLHDDAWAGERELIADTAIVVRILNSFGERERAAVQRCVQIMTKGMEHFQEGQFAHGLRDQAHLDAYCYYVAGVVGEMLTEIFCAHSPEIERNRTELQRLGISFGQGLQMTNILKDIWDDHDRGVCWLPKTAFAEHGFDLQHLTPGQPSKAFEDALAEQIGIALGHLRNALRYTEHIPSSERGIRLFCLWALGMAVLTLRKIDRNRGFQSSGDVKISRNAVRATVLLTRMAGSNTVLMRGLFSLAAWGLPRTEISPPSADAPSLID